MLEMARVICPACWQSVELEVDLSAGNQTYVEDCPVCCQPMVIQLSVDLSDPQLFSVEATAENS